MKVQLGIQASSWQQRPRCKDFSRTRRALSEQMYSLLRFSIQTVGILVEAGGGWWMLLARPLRCVRRTADRASLVATALDMLRRRMPRAGLR